MDWLTWYRNNHTLSNSSVWLWSNCCNNFLSNIHNGFFLWESQITCSISNNMVYSDLDVEIGLQLTSKLGWENRMAPLRFLLLATRLNVLQTVALWQILDSAKFWLHFILCWEPLQICFLRRNWKGGLLIRLSEIFLSGNRPLVTIWVFRLL